ncbi:glutaredoxin family protein [Brevibacillus choshinensis]|uniref:Glutaredoxin family protein n=1 Tax=Brevibacillus choshinensis TaxID=54911 RepID=A0ABX7FN03_BRECH|nr:glutaredoxin family protein [Brevibacillus choshinensis]QRG67230.1 glutaredoxin family protein [Brevibacillus choshinensis]
MGNDRAFDIVLYGRKKCHLCDEVELAIQALEKEFPLRLQLVDIESDPALHEEMMLVIPVVAIDGEVVFRSITHVVTFQELRSELLGRTNR